MKKMRINVNGKNVYGNTGDTILQVIQENRLDDIPTLCHDNRLQPFGSCFLCVVEIEGFRTLKPACATPINDGMVIKTRSEKVIAARRLALELLLSNHYADCIGPCRDECPAGVDVQGYLALIAQGQDEEAVRLIKETNPLPLVCGRVCTRPCELVCRRNQVDEGVAIDFLKRFAADRDMESKRRIIAKKEAPKDQKIAIIGSGPAGLSAAYYLALAGYAVEIFEALPEPGGMLRWGIPAYRLPRDILSREIAFITDLGPRLHVGSVWGRDFTLQDLKDNGFAAVFVAIGAQASRRMYIEGEDHPHILKGTDFLRECETGDAQVSGHVVVVGGGNTAIDCARTSLRLGADKVTILYRRTRKEMPANAIEIEEAAKEGVEMVFLSSPVAVADMEGRLQGLRCIRMELGKADRSGRRRPVPVPGSEFLLACDYAIAAIGQVIDMDFQKNAKAREEQPIEKQLHYTRWNTFECDSDTCQTNIDWIFAGGDAVSGPAIAIQAIAAGRKAAKGIHDFLTFGEVQVVKKPFYSRRSSLVSKEYIPPDRGDSHKVIMPELPLADRQGNFQEVELGLDEAAARGESERCLSCGCSAVFTCKLRQYAEEYEVDLSPFHDTSEMHDELPRDIHPFIRYELNKCILCGKCVRVCDEVRGVWAISFVNRGFKAQIQPVLDKPLLESQCISCGECVDICPTGALSEILPLPTPGPFDWQTKQRPCTQCANHCRLNFKAVADIPVTVEAGDHPLTPFSACAIGRFALTRLPAAAPAGEDDIAAFAKHMLTLKDTDAGLFVSADTTEEEAGLLSAIADTLHIDKRWLPGAWLDPRILSHVSALGELTSADLYIVTNPQRTSGNRVLDVCVRRLSKQGKQVVALYDNTPALWQLAAETIHTGSRERFAALIGHVIQHCGGKRTDTAFPLAQELKQPDDQLRQQVERLVQRIEQANRIVVLGNSGQRDPRAIALAYLLYKALQGAHDCRFSAFYDGANLRGLIAQGFKPVAGTTQGGLFYGEDPGLDPGLDKTVRGKGKRFYMDTFKPQAAGEWLPLPADDTHSGTIVSLSGQTMRLPALHHAPLSRLDILSRILAYLGGRSKPAAQASLSGIAAHAPADLLRPWPIFNTNSKQHRISRVLSQVWTEVT